MLRKRLVALSLLVVAVAVGWSLYRPVQGRSDGGRSAQGEAEFAEWTNLGQPGVRLHEHEWGSGLLC